MGRPRAAEQQAENLERLGLIQAAPAAQNFAGEGVRVITKHPDACVLCASKVHSKPRMERVFGSFQVRVVAPDKFHHAVWQALASHLSRRVLAHHCEMSYSGS